MSVTFEDLKTKYQNKPTIENEASCKVLIKLKDGYLVDINNEWEGFIPNSHMSVNFDTELNLQDSFNALIISEPDKSDRCVVSPRALKEKSIWGNLQNIKDENKILNVTISKVIKGGAEVFINGLRAFLPGRYIRIVGISQDHWAGQEITVLIEELDYKEKKIILNQRKAYELERKQKAEEAIQRLSEGDIVEVPVLRIAKFGVFVDLGGLDGLIPASELSFGRFNHPKEIIKVGEILKARIFRIEKEDYRVALSVKQILGDPWDQIDSDLEINKTITGRIISEAPFGFFVELKPGVEGLIHNSEISEGRENLKVGSSITAKIIKIDLDQRKIGLSLRDLVDSQESTVDSTEPIIDSLQSTVDSTEPTVDSTEPTVDSLQSTDNNEQLPLTNQEVIISNEEERLE